MVRNLNTADRERVELLPGWITVFAWLFLISFLLYPVLFIWYWTDPNQIDWTSFKWNWFGLTHQGPPWDLFALLILATHGLFSLAAYGLLWGRFWGLRLGIFCGVFGAVTASGRFIYTLLFGENYIDAPVELALQIPFVIKLFRLKHQWESPPDTQREV